MTVTIRLKPYNISHNPGPHSATGQPHGLRSNGLLGNRAALSVWSAIPKFSASPMVRSMPMVLETENAAPSMTCIHTPRKEHSGERRLPLIRGDTTALPQHEIGERLPFFTPQLIPVIRF